MKVFLLSAAIVFLSCCHFSTAYAGTGNQQLIEMLMSDNTDQMNYAAEQIAAFGVRGIPLLLEALSESLKAPYLVTNYGRSNICLRTLHNLADSGIYTLEEVPVLISALKKQICIGDTYLTADTLRLVTGIDTGYSEEFINTYTANHEEDRCNQIAEWEKWWGKNKAGASQTRVEDQA